MYDCTKNNLNNEDFNYAAHYGCLEKYRDLGSDFISTAQEVWVSRLEGLAKRTIKNRSDNISVFLKFLQQLKYSGYYIDFFKKLSSDHLNINATWWEIIQGDFLTHLESNKNRGNKYKNTIIKSTRRFLQYLASSGVIPHLSWLATFHEERINSSYADEFVSALVLRDRLVHQEQECSRDEACDIINTYEALTEYCSSESLKVDAKNILYIISKQLTEARSMAEQEVKKGFAKLAVGEDLISSSDISPEEIEHEVRRIKELSKTQSPSMRAINKDTYSSLFPNGSVGLARALCYARWKWGMVPVGIGTERKQSDWEAQFVNVLLDQGHGGSAQIDSFISPTPRLLTAVAILVMIDTGANPTPIYNLSRKDCLVRDDNYPDYRWITWMKDRAKGEIKRKLLPLKDSRYEVSSVEALYRIIESTKYLSLKAQSTQSDFVFIFGRWAMYRKIEFSAESQGRVRRVGDDTFRVHFNEIINESRYIKNCNISARKLRTLILLRTALETRSIFKVQEVGQHASIKTSWGYVQKLPYYLEHEKVIRDFLENLEVLVTSSNDNFCDRAEVDSYRYENRAKRLHETGLGLDCLDIRSGIQPETVKGQVCHRVDKCLTCRNARRQIQADEHTIADIILWNRHLKKERDRLIYENAKRWEEVWLPWEIFCEVVLNKVRSKGALRRVLKTAENIAASTKRIYPSLS